MKKTLITIFASLFLFSSCDLDTFPDNMVTDGDIEQIEEISTNITEGTYSTFKSILKFQNQEYTGNTYVRHFFQMAEFPSDNITLAGRTSDPLYEANTYKRSASVRNVQYLWYAMYQVIKGANNVIPTIGDDAAPLIQHIKGENLVMRATAYIHLSQLWSRPYSHGRENMGVPLVLTTEPTEITRATVGEVYDQIVADLEEAAELMSHSKKRGESTGSISMATAQGLLSRVYLYREENDKVVSMVDKMLAGADPMSKLVPTANYSKLFAEALSSSEVLWAVEHSTSDNRGTSSLASMYNSVNGVGWGEVYAADPLIDLYNRYPEDKRSEFIEPQYKEGDQYTVRWAVKGVEDFYLPQTEDVTWDASAKKYYMTLSGSKIYVETESVDTYPQNYVTVDGTKNRARISKKMDVRMSYPKFFVNKFSYQNGDAMLSSPVVIRWAEVILNRAEAYAKLNQTDKALTDVNTIRARAGLSGNTLFTTANMHGYANAMDVVLDERRMELAFEGHRMHDIFRNKKSLDRRYTGVQPWEVVDHKDNRTVYLISSDEIEVSKIPQNP